MMKRGRGRPRKLSHSSSPPCESAEFFKVFLPHLCSHQLLIPPDFIKDFGRTINEKVILKDIGGKQWQVDVHRTPNGVFLKNGWQSFVDYYCLKVGDFLVFRYDRSYTFIVKIFGRNGCKKGPFAAKNIATHVKAEEKADEDIEGKQTSSKRARLHEDDHLLSGNQRATRSREKMKDLKNADRVPVPPYFISNPCQSNQYKLQIPNEVIESHNLNLEGEMTLRTVGGKEWPVNVYSGKDGRKYIGSGWWSFQKDNKMGAKDSCIFTFPTERLSRTINVKILLVKVW
ncbi:hypothetical protein CDL12_10143 [Handroanthus impetiginosus]|uniref:TF-B3 domain-containing protein n=1 Tax=Handroanthus impetiginosus TaxID=429701 RepID=A0A2G9HI80_9LAMI|nr:hypothetical protein CDL12_10143 [Handroanthus impetiginosus]